MSFKGRYTMQSHGWPGPAYVLCSAHRTTDRSVHVSVKLFARGMDYLQEKALLETPTITLQEYLPGDTHVLTHARTHALAHSLTHPHHHSHKACMHLLTHSRKHARTH